MTARPDVPGADPTPWRFRRLLALYPAQWQAENGEAMLGVMLDAAEAEQRTGPTAREAVSTLGHATGQWRSRLQARDDGVLGSFAALGPAAVVSGAVVAVLGLCFGELAPHLVRGAATPDASPLRGLATLGIAAHLPWLVVVAAALTGRSALARRALRVAAVLPAVVVIVSHAAGPPRPGLGMLAALTIFAGTGALAWPDAGTGLRRRTAAALLVGWGVGGALVVQPIVTAPAGNLTWMHVGQGFYRLSGLAELAGVATVVSLGAIAAGLLLVLHRPGVLVTASIVGGTWIVLTHAGMPGDGPGSWILSRYNVVPVAALLAGLLTLSLLSTGVRLVRPLTRRSVRA